MSGLEVFDVLRLGAPFMTLALMALLVIPSLKLGPTGLFDVKAFKPVGLFAG